MSFGDDEQKMSRFWRFLAQFFNNLAKRPLRGKAILDGYGRSVRERAFDHFNEGLRPAQLPDLGVPKRTLYRYFQSWKRGGKRGPWRVLKQLLMRDLEARQVLAGHFGVSDDEVLQAVRRARNRTQLKKLLRVDEILLLDNILEDARELQLAAVVHRLRRCSTTAARKGGIVHEAQRMGIAPGELLSLLLERNQAEEERQMRGRGLGSAR